MGAQPHHSAASQDYGNSSTHHADAHAAHNGDANRDAADAHQGDTNRDAADAHQGGDRHTADTTGRDRHDAQKTGRSVGEDNGGGHGRIGEAQRGHVIDSIRREHVENIHVDFAVNVGVVVPGRYHFRPLPEDVVVLVPQYRGYDFFVADDEIIIIEPGTHRIVDVIPEG
jgi:hypothetical protein